MRNYHQAAKRSHIERCCSTSGGCRETLEDSFCSRRRCVCRLWVAAFKKLSGSICIIIPYRWRCSLLSCTTALYVSIYLINTRECKYFKTQSVVGGSDYLLRNMTKRESDEMIIYFNNNSFNLESKKNKMWRNL